MRAGTLRHQITIEKGVESRETDGAAILTWSSGLNTWADIQPLRGDEYFSAQQVQAGVTHKIRIRNNIMIASTIIGPEHRIKFGSRYFGIKAISRPSERDIMLEMLCVEKV